MKESEKVALLSSGEITVVGRIPESSNQALLVQVERDDVSAFACYKCTRGERRLWDFPDGLWRREVAAYDSIGVLATNLVPTTVQREDGPFGPGSLQWWITENGIDHYFTLRDRTEFAAWFVTLAAFDVVANNADRKSGHVIFDGERCWAIDNGLSFHEDNKLRTVIWDFAETPVSAAVRERLVAFADGAVGDLGKWLSPTELALTQMRAGELADEGVLPVPDDDREWPPYPWPLV